MTQSKESQKKEYAMNNQKYYTWSHAFRSNMRMLTIANMHAFLILQMFDLATCMYVHTAIDRREWVFFDSSSQLSAKCNCWVVWYCINSPPHMHPHEPYLYSYTAKTEDVAFSFDNLQSLELQSGLYSTICIQNPTYSNLCIQIYNGLFSFLFACIIPQYCVVA